MHIVLKLEALWIRKKSALLDELGELQHRFELLRRETDTEHHAELSSAAWVLRKKIFIVP
jgi:hypothetical protein